MAGDSDFQRFKVNLFWFLVSSERVRKRKTTNIPLFYRARCPLFTWVVVYFSLRGFSWPSALRQTMIKPCVMVWGTHLNIITGSWRVKSVSTIWVIYHLSLCWCCFITTCTVVWTEKPLPSGSDWLQVEIVRIAANTKAESHFSLVKLFFLPQMDTFLKS